MYLWLKPDFQQVHQVKTKTSDKEVDMLEEDVSPCLHYPGVFGKVSFPLCSFMSKIKGVSYLKTELLKKCCLEWKHLKTPSVSGGVAG